MFRLVCCDGSCDDGVIRFLVYVAVMLLRCSWFPCLVLYRSSWKLGCFSFPPVYGGEVACLERCFVGCIVNLFYCGSCGNDVRRNLPNKQGVMCSI